MFEQITRKIEEHDAIVIFGHLNPDGDCYGSQVALRAILKKQYPSKAIYAVGSGFPNFFPILGNMDNVSLETIKNSLAIILDSNDLKRVEDARVFEACDYAKIDHHIDLHTYHEGVEVVDDHATSTSELIFKFAKENNFEIPLLAAEALYLGLFTDTARFQYADDYIQMFDIAKELISLGVVPTKITAILNTTNEYSLKIRAFIYRHYKKDKAGILYVYATKEERDHLNLTTAQIVSNTGLISHVKKYPVWLIAAETDEGGIQVEMRSNLIDVQEIAASFGGGGHTYAAGFTAKENAKEVFKELLARIKKSLKEKRG